MCEESETRPFLTFFFKKLVFIEKESSKNKIPCLIKSICGQRKKGEVTEQTEDESKSVIAGASSGNNGWAGAFPLAGKMPLVLSLSLCSKEH